MISFINYALNLVFPKCCGICEKICKDNICPKCIMKLNNISKFKINQYKNKYFEEHLYIFKYTGIIKDRLIDFKFNNKPYIYKTFVDFIIKNKKICRFLKSYDIIIPVPIHYNRKLTRGYNQSVLIAKKIANNLEIYYSNKVLFKNKNNKPQSTKNKNDRENNVIGVYNINNTDLIKNKKVILLDDIYTTGSTVNECSKILKQAGAKKILVFTIAKD